MGEDMTSGGGFNVGGDFGKPLDRFICKISDAIGFFFEPAKIRRIAQAQADAKIIDARAEAAADEIAAEAHIKITERQRRAAMRLIKEEDRKQANMEAIAMKAIPYVGENAASEKLESDWVSEVFESCRNVSDQQMQDLWARLLAGEANAPGAFSRQTLRVLSAMDHRDAAAFRAVCSFAWRIDGTPLLFIKSTEKKSFTDAGANFDSMTHLQEIGLVTFDPLAGYVEKREETPTFIAEYGGMAYKFKFKNGIGGRLELGQALFSRAGRELCAISDATPNEEFRQDIISSWKMRGIRLASDEAPVPDDASQNVIGLTDCR